MIVERPDAAARVEVRFDSRIYSLTTVKKAAYRLLKSFTTDIVQDGDYWLCILDLATPTEDDAEIAARKLRSEVLDQDLRETVSRETAAVRNAILALAFSRTGLQTGD